MIDVTRIYNVNKYDDGLYLCDYTPMLEAFGNIAIRVDDDDYQGDTRVLLDNNGKIGHIIFGWGSCSGCDALQGCDTVEELQDLCDSLERQVMWFDTVEKAIDYFTNHDWAGDYTCNDDNTKIYIEKVLKYLHQKK